MKYVKIQTEIAGPDNPDPFAQFVQSAAQKIIAAWERKFLESVCVWLGIPAELLDGPATFAPPLGFPTEFAKAAAASHTSPSDESLARCVSCHQMVKVRTLTHGEETASMTDMHKRADGQWCAGGRPW